MKATEILMNEHRVIEPVLNALEEIVSRGLSQGRLDQQSASDAVAFFRDFVDRCHHAKEEEHLFKAVELYGFSGECGPTKIMRYEHELGRAHVRAMDEALPAASAGDPAALARFADHARGYVELLREHIRKEDHCLFPMADQVLDAPHQAALLAAFDKVETEEMGAGMHEAFHKIADDLAARFHVPQATCQTHSACAHGA
ncbi:MAG: hemerythrin domain-containing protein [Pirellulales bacterium]